MAHILTIKAIENLTPDVLRIVTTKPKRISYKPGQAVDLSINQPDWKDELRAFTFTSLEEDNNLEFTIKTYSERNGMTHELTKLKAGDELIIQHPFGSITYKGPGVFIAGGSGITPFLAIFKMLERNRAIGENKLIFGNRTQKDIISEEYLGKLLGNKLTHVLSNVEHSGELTDLQLNKKASEIIGDSHNSFTEKEAIYLNGYITEELIRKHINDKLKYYYLCGPQKMMESVENHLSNIGINEEFIVKEEF